MQEAFTQLTKGNHGSIKTQYQNRSKLWFQYGLCRKSSPKEGHHGNIGFHSCQKRQGFSSHERSYAYCNVHVPTHHTKTECCNPMHWSSSQKRELLKESPRRQTSTCDCHIHSVVTCGCHSLTTVTTHLLLSNPLTCDSRVFCGGVGPSHVHWDLTQAGTQLGWHMLASLWCSGFWWL